MGYKDKLGQDSGGVLGNQELGQRPLVGHRLAIILDQPAAQLQPHRKNDFHIPKNPGLNYCAHEVGLCGFRSGLERLGPSSQSFGVAPWSKSSPTGLIGVSAGLAQQRHSLHCAVPLSPLHPASGGDPFYFLGGHHAEITH